MKERIIIMMVNYFVTALLALLQQLIKEIKLLHLLMKYMIVFVCVYNKEGTITSINILVNSTEKDKN